MANNIKELSAIALAMYPTVYKKAVEEMDKKGYTDPDWRIDVAMDCFKCAEAFLVAESVYQEKGND